MINSQVSAQNMQCFPHNVYGSRLFWNRGTTKAIFRGSLLWDDWVSWRTFNICGTFQIQVIKIDCSLKVYLRNQKIFFYGKKKLIHKLLGTLFLGVQDYWCLGSLNHQLSSLKFFVELFLWKISHLDCIANFYFQEFITWCHLFKSIFNVEYCCFWLPVKLGSNTQK